MTLASLTLVLLLQNTAGSLFSDSAPSLYLFRDLKARAIGDILTIQISESATASNSAKTDTKKQGDVSIKAANFGGLEKGNSALDFANILTASSALNFAGAGTTARTGQLQAFLSARVIQVCPNGDLEIDQLSYNAFNILYLRGNKIKSPLMFLQQGLVVFLDFFF